MKKLNIIYLNGETLAIYLPIATILATMLPEPYSILTFGVIAVIDSIKNEILQLQIYLNNHFFS